MVSTGCMLEYPKNLKYLLIEGNNLKDWAISREAWIIIYRPSKTTRLHPNG